MSFSLILAGARIHFLFHQASLNAHVHPSADLWVVPLNNVSVPDSIDTGARANVSYAIGSVSGPVKTAELVFAGYTVPNQAFSKSQCAS